MQLKKFYRNDTLEARFALTTQTPAVQIQFGQSPAANLLKHSADTWQKTAQSSRKAASYYLGAMAPLDLSNDIALKRFDTLLKDALDIGVQHISVDVWWGKVATDPDPKKWQWQHYDKAFQLIKKHQLNIDPIL